jgi:hypothetical protein
MLVRCWFLPSTKDNESNKNRLRHWKAAFCLCWLLFVHSDDQTHAESRKHLYIGPYR